MKKTYAILLILLFSLCTTAKVFAADDYAGEHEAKAQHEVHQEDGDLVDHDKEGSAQNTVKDKDEDGHGHDEENGREEENVSQIAEAMANQVGIETSVVAPQTLHQTVTAYGALTAGPENVSHIRARFSGLVKTVRGSIGDQVQAGDVLAEIESNESLKIYPVRAPISGLIVQRHANTGEVTQDQVLFSVVNLDTLWAELRVFPQQQNYLREQQPVRVLVRDQSLEGRIDHIIPVLDKPYLLARIRLDNEKRALSPGLLVEGRIAVDTFDVPFAIEKDAVQSVGGRRGVFVKQGENYAFTPVVLGRDDDQFYEVLSGLEAGAEYVTKNSYLIKADIEKSEAEHEH